jgi:phosphohistidine phosphatase
MQALIIRHAIAEEPEEFDGPDEFRPLTRKGRRKMLEAAQGLARLVKRIDVLASSPLIRAVQTAQILADEFHPAELLQRDELAPGATPEKLLAWLAKRDVGSTVALVGHEPNLSKFIAYASTHGRSEFVQLGKGAACMIEFEADPAPGTGVIAWLMQSKQLRKMAG